MERLYADRLAEQVESLAHHAARGEAREGRCATSARPGPRRSARSATREAAGFFEHALAILAELPETPDTLSEALDLRIALGPALIGLKRACSPEVVASYDHAQALLDRLGDTDRRFPVLWGRWFIAYTRGDYAGGAGHR